MTATLVERRTEQKGGKEDCEDHNLLFKDGIVKNKNT